MKTSPKSEPLEATSNSINFERMFGRPSSDTECTECVRSFIVNQINKPFMRKTKTNPHVLWPLHVSTKFPSSSWHWGICQRMSMNTWLTQVQRCKSYFAKYKHSAYERCAWLVYFHHSLITRNWISTGRQIHRVPSVWNHPCNTRAVSHTETAFAEGTLYIIPTHIICPSKWY